MASVGRYPDGLMAKEDIERFETLVRAECLAECRSRLFAACPVVSIDGPVAPHAVVLCHGIGPRGSRRAAPMRVMVVVGREWMLQHCIPSRAFLRM